MEAKKEPSPFRWASENPLKFEEKKKKNQIEKWTLTIPSSCLGGEITSDSLTIIIMTIIIRGSQCQGRRRVKRKVAF
jgi:hypothetical protein